MDTKHKAEDKITKEILKKFPNKPIEKKLIRFGQ